MGSFFQTLGLSTAVWLAGCSVPGDIASIECTPIDVFADGKPLIGIEDMARKDANTLVLSAYNRADAQASPKGLFELDLRQPDGPLKAERVTLLDDPILPHGFTYDPVNGHIYVIDRSTKPYPAIKRYDAGEKAQSSTLLANDGWSQNAAYPCNMNDLTLTTGGSLFVTNDRRSCSTVGKWIDNLFGRANGSLWSLNADGSADLEKGGLFFPNGVERTNNGAILVAETRSEKVIRIDAGSPIPVPGAPDNLSLDAQGTHVWAALVPSLGRYALFRFGLQSALKTSRMSRMSVAADDAASVQTFETGEFVGATTALTAHNYLYLSGAYSRGIARCEVPNV